MTGRLHAAGCVFAEEEARLLLAEAGTAAELEAMVDARSSGVPLEQVLGWAQFSGHRVGVEPGVFVPRRRTEFLVAAAVFRLRIELGRRASGRRPVVVLDVCCGTGALGLAVVSELAATSTRVVDLHAVDVDPAAVRCARQNLDGLGAVYAGDLFEPLPQRLRGRVDLVLANVPYVPSAEIGLLPAEAREHEPLVALDGGSDGLDVLRRLAADVPAWLAPTGWVLVEVSTRQAEGAAAAFAAAGLAVETLASHDPEPPATVVAASPPRGRQSTGFRGVSRRI